MMPMRAEQLFQSAASGLSLLVLGIIGFTAAYPARAQQDSFPSRTITIVVPAPAGGSADFLTRALTSPLSAMTGQTIVVDNRPGAGGVVGAERWSERRPTAIPYYLKVSPPYWWAPIRPSPGPSTRQTI